jgi:hypothetical protein
VVPRSHIRIDEFREANSILQVNTPSAVQWLNSKLTSADETSQPPTTSTATDARAQVVSSINRRAQNKAYMS